MLEWANLLTGLVSFVTSLAVGIILRNKDRKEAEKIRQEDLNNLERQFQQLKKQAEAAQENVSILWAEKQIRDLGPKLNVTVKNVNASEFGRNVFIETHFIIKNPTRQTMRINNFRLHNENPFVFEDGGIFGKYPMGFKPENEKCMSLKNPFLANLETGTIFDCFNLDAHEEIEFILKVRHLKPDIVSTPIFIIEHTSSNHAEKILETTFWPNFLLPFQ